MALAAVDFGTCNTLLARVNESSGQTETVALPGITVPVAYRAAADAPELTVHVVPSLIHYGAEETLIGAQVLARGLLDHPDTFRWMKRAVAGRNTDRRKTPQGHKGYVDASSDFLLLALRYAGEALPLDSGEVTFTAPVESFEDFEDWLRETAARAGAGRCRLLDEASASVFGYEGLPDAGEAFMVVDFGGGTLDVSVVRMDPSSATEKKAIQLGRAGENLGGMDVDHWIADDFRARHGLDDAALRAMEPMLLRLAEQCKIALSSPDIAEEPLTLVNDLGPAPVVHRTVYARDCDACRGGGRGGHPGRDRACLGCLLDAGGFTAVLGATLTRALENARAANGGADVELKRVLVTGGTSLIPALRRCLRARFGDRVFFDRPFDTVARGACAAVVIPLLQHDYAIESYSPERDAYEFRPLLPRGTGYPTPPDTVRLWGRGAYDGQTRVGLRIFEVSQMRRRAAAVSLSRAGATAPDETRVATENAFICLNRDNPTFIEADPPIETARDAQRFLCAFQVDAQRRLLVTVTDRLRDIPLLRDHPVVRL